MPMRSGLSVYCFVAPGNTNLSPTAVEIGSLITELSFASAAPGGFTTLSALLPLRDARIPRPEFGLFAQIAVMDGPVAVWIGEITDPEQGMDENLGEYLRLSCLGVGNALRDDIQSVSWVNTTAKTIVGSMLGVDTAGAPDSLIPTIANDGTLIFPDNPPALFGPSYVSRGLDEIIADVAQLAGDYQWGTWAHPTIKNRAGFPMGQLSVQKRDTATTHYSASLAEQDIITYTVTPSAERAYNEIDIYFTNSASGVSQRFFIDPRINPSTYGQNKAPFRFRRLVRDYSGISTLTGAQAQAIANTYGAMYKDPSNKVSLTLQRVHDTGGQPLPLWSVLADHNIFIKDFAPRGAAPLPTKPTAGVNQFYIVNAEYRENQTTQQLILQCDNFVDRVASQIARLTLAADVKSRTGRVAQVTQMLGAPASGYVGIGQNNALAGQNCVAGIQFPAALYQPPTSIAFTTVTNTNLTGIAAGSINALGAVVAANAVANGLAKGGFTYTTSGNCIRRVGRTLFDWHCDGCDKEFRGLHLGVHLRVQTQFGTRPGEAMLAIDCPECGAGEQPFTESFNTALTSADEAPINRHTRHPHRMEQARFIRQLMRHGAVGLAVLP